MRASNLLHGQNLIRAISGIYNTMHLFNLNEGSCEEVYSFQVVHDMYEALVDNLDNQQLIHHIIKKTTSKEYLKPLLEFTDFSTINERLCNKKILSFDFVGAIHGWTRCSFIPVEYNEDNSIKIVAYTTRIVQSDKEKEEGLLLQADIDETTGFYNRSAYERDSQKYNREGMPKFLTTLSFDVNGLKDINNTLGIQAGDEVVLGAAECIKQVFGEKGKIYRLGGDVYYGIIDCDLIELMNLFGRFDTVTANWRGNLVQGLTISKGCATHAEFPSFTFRELQAKADQRMYREKEIFYQTQRENKEDSVNNPVMFAQIMQKSYMGIVSIEFDEYNAPRLILDDHIKDFMGFDSRLTLEQLYEEWLNRIHPDYSDTISSGIEKIIIGNQTEVQYPWFHPKAGLIYIRSFGYRDPNYTQGVRILGFFQNVTHLIHLQKDTLTGFYTKEIFFQKADEILKENPEKNYRFFVSDIENFKALNEKYGSEVSDKLLKYLAKSLKQTVPNLVLCGRLDSDIFVCMQEDFDVRQTRKEGWDLQQKILDNAPVQNFVWKHGVYYTKIERDISAQLMCDRARSAVESIKGNYLVSCAAYDDHLAKSIKTKRQIIENMEDALKNKEFCVYLQPKHDLHEDKTGGAEALVRWIHPEIGFMNPGDFIPVFETNGFVKNVDKFVFIEVCSIIKKWMKEGKPIVPISVNLSRRDFEHDNLAEVIIGYTDSEGIPRKYIHLEVTESAFSDNPERIAKTIHKLHDAGFIIELDDFGTGYSSLTSLSEIEFDILKLDMSIIRKDNPESARNVLDMCSQIVKQMKLKSVAEGVENEAQLQRLKSLGCDYIQGYYFSKPLPVEDFEKYLSNEV